MAEGKSRLVSILGIVGGIVSLITVLGGILMLVFATKGELADEKASLVTEIHGVQKTAQKNAGEANLQAWRHQALQVQVENVTKAQTQTNENVIKLLERFRVRPVDGRRFAARPLPPKPDLGAPDGDSDHP